MDAEQCKLAKPATFGDGLDIANPFVKIGGNNPIGQAETSVVETNESVIA